LVSVIGYVSAPTITTGTRVILLLSLDLTPN